MPSPVMAVALAALTVAASGVAVAAIPGPSGTIYACYANDDIVKQLTAPANQVTRIVTPAGTIRVRDEGDACNSGESELSFNRRGPVGPAGPIGPQGAPGPVGPASAIATNGPLRLKNGASPAMVISRVPGAGRYLVWGTVQYDFGGGSTSSAGDLTCMIPSSTEGKPIANSRAAWTANLAAGSLALNNVVVLKTDTQRVRIVCDTAHAQDGKVEIVPKLVLLKLG